MREILGPAGSGRNNSQDVGSVSWLLMLLGYLDIRRDTTKLT